MTARAVPPAEISPAEFFERWVPNAVHADQERRSKIEGLSARIQFELEGDGGGLYYLALNGGSVHGYPGRTPEPDLTLHLSVETWRRLNAGELNAMQAAATRVLRFHGNLYLALKVHFLLR